MSSFVDSTPQNMKIVNGCLWKSQQKIGKQELELAMPQR